MHSRAWVRHSFIGLIDSFIMAHNQNKTAIVTGASRGIGLATALRFGRAGYSLVIAARSPGDLEQALKQVRETGVECEAVPVDVGTAAGGREVVDVARGRFGRVDVLVNNAGAAPLASIPETSDADFERCISANIASAFYCTRAVWPLMRAGGGGTIVNLSSLAAVSPFPGFSVYGGAKAWVSTFTRAAADEGKPLGIRVFAVGPGATETQMLRRHFKDIPAAETLDPDEVAALIEACCGPALAHSVGQTIFVQK